MKRVIVLALVLALFAGTVGCPASATRYELSISSSEGGDVTTPGEGVFNYGAGTVIEIIAEAEEGYRFVNWTGDVVTVADINASSTTITVDGNHSITANFEEIPKHGLAITSTTGGSVMTPGEGDLVYYEGSVVSLVAEAQEGYRFVNWTGDTEGIAEVDAASTTVIVNADYSVTANFVAQYLLTVDSTVGGSVTAPGEGVFAYDVGTVVELVAQAGEGYVFVNWTVDVDTIADVDAESSTITMDGHYSLTARFFQGQLVRDWHDLHAIRTNLGGSYLLMNDLDSTTDGYEELAGPTANDGKGWEPIGGVFGVEPYGGAFDHVEPFVGSFDGQGHQVRSMFIDRPHISGVGLFGTLQDPGVIKNIGLVDIAVTGDWIVGGLVGLNLGGTVSSSYAKGNVAGTGRVGGVAGRNAGATVIDRSYSSGSVTGGWCVGGLAASNSGGTVSGSHSTADVSGSTCVGGLVGINWEKAVHDSYATGRVSGQNNVGGLVGWNYRANVTNSYSVGKVTGHSNAGGLVGLNEGGTVSNSFWDIQTSGMKASDGGTGKTTVEMQDSATFVAGGWSIIAVDAGDSNLAYGWNIVDGQTYPFLSWQSVS